MAFTRVQTAPSRLTFTQTAHLILLLVALAATFGFHSINEVWASVPPHLSAAQQHAAEMNDTHSIFAYRVLVKYMVEYLHDLTGLSLEYSYDLYHFVFFSLALLLFLHFLRRYLPDSYSLAGVLLLAAFYPITFNLISPVDIFVLFLFALGNYLLTWPSPSHRPAMLATILIGTLAKDVTVFLLVPFALLEYLEFKKDNRKDKSNSHLLWIVGGVLAYAIPYTLLRLTFGFFPYNLSAFAHNLQALKAIVLLMLSFGPLALLASFGFSRKPLALQIITVGYALYVLSILFIGNIDETRLFLPLLLILAPLGLLNLKESGRHT